MSKLVIAKCNNCDSIAERIKSRGGIGCYDGGRYCGTMRIIRYVGEEE